jgi:hypothetical protein
LRIIFSHQDSEKPGPADPPKTARAIAKPAEPCHRHALPFLDTQPLPFAVQTSTA